MNHAYRNARIVIVFKNKYDYHLLLAKNVNTSLFISCYLIVSGVHNARRHTKLLTRTTLVVAMHTFFDEFRQ